MIEVFNKETNSICNPLSGRWFVVDKHITDCFGRLKYNKVMYLEDKFGGWHSEYDLIIAEVFGGV